MERFVRVSSGTRLWVQECGAADAPPLLLIMGANASGVAWPDELVHTLAEPHRVIRYDHRDTGRSTWAFDADPYPVSQLADDAITILNALEVARAHVVGMSMGGTLVQVLLLDHPDRLRSATIFATSALGAGWQLTPMTTAPRPYPHLIHGYRNCERTSLIRAAARRNSSGVSSTGGFLPVRCCRFMPRNSADSRNEPLIMPAVTTTRPRTLARTRRV